MANMTAGCRVSLESLKVYEIAFGEQYGEKFEWMSKFFSELYTHFGVAFFYGKTDNMLGKSLHASYKSRRK